MSHLALLKDETQAIKNPPPTFQTVSLGTSVNIVFALLLDSSPIHSKFIAACLDTTVSKEEDSEGL